MRGGQGTARLVMAGPGPAVRVVGDHQGTADPNTVQPHTWEKERFPVLSGFEILGAHPEADGIELDQTMQAVVRSMLIRECRYGIRLVTRNRNVIIADSHIYNCSDSGIFMDQVNLHQTNILGNHISYCSRGGIRQLNGDVHNVQITGNDIEYNSGFEGISGEILLEAPESGMISEYTIASNTIQATPDAPGANIVITGRDEDHGFSIGIVTIAGNVIGSRSGNIFIENARRATSISGNVIYSGIAACVHLRKCENLTLGANSIVPLAGVSYGNAGQGGVVLEDCAACAVTGNNINGHDAGTPEDGGSVTLVRCRDASVASCQILDPLHRGVYLQDAVRCRVSDNTIVDRREQPAMVAAVEVVGDSRGNVVQNNLVAKGSADAIVCETACGVVRTNTVVNVPAEDCVPGWEVF
jgi:hypothetical protein